MARLCREFYARDTLDAARALLGKVLVRRLEGETLAGRVVETEAYVGRCDKACHAYGYRRTARTETLFAPPGRAEPAAVLLRALEPVAGTETMARLRYGDKPLTAYRKKNFLNGPGKVCRALALTRAENGLDLTGDTLFLCDGPEDIGLAPFPVSGKEHIIAGPRIGVDYAEEARDFPWRFRLAKED